MFEQQKMSRNSKMKREKKMKRMKSLFVLMVMFLALGIVGIVGAQTDTVTDAFTLTVEPVAVLAVDGVLGNFTIGAPEFGGEELIISDPDDNSLLQYTSVVANGGFRSITVHPSGNLPDGIILYVEADHSISGEGEQGDPAAQVHFTHDTVGAQTIVTGIGSCFTGTGNSDGARLTYWLEIDNIGDLLAATTTITMTYTLTDDVSG
jgi:hypothetical protein